MQFQSYKIADLIPASYNPRKKLKPGDKEYEKIKNSIKEFGYVEPIIINSDMTIIGGHQRATVLADLGYTEVECIVVDIDKTKDVFIENLKTIYHSRIQYPELNAATVNDSKQRNFGNLFGNRRKQ